MTRTRAWLAPLLLFALAALLRLPLLDLRPLHHDEGTNFIFLLRLLREGTYKYDPANYHGPLYYYLTVVALRLGGVTATMLRLSTAIAGAALAPLAWGLRRELGTAGAAAAGLLLATSPSLVYYARDSIHESVLVCFTLVLVCAAARGAATGGFLWIGLAGAAAGCMVATKETAWLTFGALGAGIVAVRVLAEDGERVAPRRRPGILGGVLVAGAVVTAFYSSFFHDWAGVAAPFRAIVLWSHRALGDPEGHGKPWWYFTHLLAREEWVIGAAAIAGVFAAIRRRDRAAVGLLGWSGATLLIYSAFRYKTPWLLLNPILPLALLGGRGWEAFWRRAAPSGRARLAAILFAGLLASAAVRAATLSFVLHDEDGASPLVYVQTRRDVVRLAERIEAYASRHPEGHAVRVAILARDYLPLNWYLRDFGRAAYHGRVVGEPEADVVIAGVEDGDEVGERLGPLYRREVYPLRPGVRLVLFLRILPE